MQIEKTAMMIKRAFMVIMAIGGEWDDWGLGAAGSLHLYKIHTVKVFNGLPVFLVTKRSTTMSSS